MKIYLKISKVRLQLQTNFLPPQFLTHLIKKYLEDKSYYGIFIQYVSSPKMRRSLYLQEVPNDFCNESQKEDYSWIKNFQPGSGDV